jgi:tetratricopeptide (TPR) repeat protein
MAAIKLEKYSDAVNDCNCVLKMDPDNVKAFLRRGSAKQSQGLYKAAEDDLKKVLELEPNNSRGKELLIQVRAQLQNQKTKPNQLDQQKQTEQKPVNQKPAEQRPKGRPIPITEVDNMNDEDDSKEESTTQEEAKSDGKKQETSSNECQITEKLTETSDGMEMGNRCQTGEEAESTTQEEVESNGKKQETRPSSDECETTEKLTEASDGTGMENRYYTGEEEENTTETMEEEVDVNRNPSHAVLKEGTDGGNLSQQSEPENEHKDNEDDEEELPPLEDSSNEMPILPSFVPSDPPLPIPLKALELKNEGMSLFRAGDYAHAFEKYSSAIDSMEPGKIN